MFARRAMMRRPLVTAAVVGGTAYYVGKKNAQGQAHEAAQDQQIAAMQQQAPQPGYAPAPPPAQPTLTDQIGELVRLHDSGVLTDAEYASAKAKLIS